MPRPTWVFHNSLVDCLESITIFVFEEEELFLSKRVEDYFLLLSLP